MIKTDKSIIYQSSLFLSRFYPPLSVSICGKYLFLFLIKTGVELAHSLSFGVLTLPVNSNLTEH